jgi:hypothetical protein
MTLERTTYPDGWDVQTGYYLGELRAEATEDCDERVVCLGHTTDGDWVVSLGHSRGDPEHTDMFDSYEEAANEFLKLLDDPDAHVYKSGVDVMHGDVYQTDDGPIQVKGIQTNGDVVVTDPTVSNPQDSRAGRWTIARFQFEDSLARGEIEPASLEVA